MQLVTTIIANPYIVFAIFLIPTWILINRSFKNISLFMKITYTLIASFGFTLTLLGLVSIPYLFMQ